MARGYGSQNQPRDYYDPANERGGGMNQNPTSSRLINNALNVASSSNIPSNSGRCLSELSSINNQEHKMLYNNDYITNRFATYQVYHKVSCPWRISKILKMCMHLLTSLHFTLIKESFATS